MQNAALLRRNPFEGPSRKPLHPVENAVRLHSNKVKEALDYRNMPDFIELEKQNRGMAINYDTVDQIFKRYPKMTMKRFKSYFFGGYNKIILISGPEILDLIDLDKIAPGNDLIEHVAKKISLTEEEFQKKIEGKFDVMTFPNMSEMSVAQAYFHRKLSASMPETQIIFGDNPKIKEHRGINELQTDSVGFIDVMGRGMFNTCIFKLLRTEPDEKKLKELNELFGGVGKDIFIGGSTSFIPFSIPEDMQEITFPKVVAGDGGLKLAKNMLLNSMGYLNTAYYADKSKAAFVYGTHNIAEPLHAGKLTVISNDPKNRYNHNWMVSYFGEKASLLTITEGTPEEQQKEVDGFLSISQEELKARYAKFAIMYEEEIKPLVYGIFYNHLKNAFPEKFRSEK